MTTRRFCAVSSYSTKKVVLFALGFLIVSVLALSLVATSSASSERTASVDNGSSFHTWLTPDPAKKPEKQDEITQSPNFIKGHAVGPALLLLPQGPAETVETYAADCTTPKQTFSVGEVACAKATGTLVGPRVLYWVDFQGELAQVDVITSGTPSASRSLSGAGNWKVYLSSGLDGTLRATARFGVSDPQQPSVDLAIFNFIASGSSFTDNGFIKYQVTALNKGPDTASAVQLTHDLPNNAAFVSSSQDSGTSFHCTNNSLNTTCTSSSLASGDSATFTFIYQVTGGTPVGTSVSTTANITSSTEESHTPDNSSSISASVVSDGSGATCTLDCPNNIVVTANTTQGTTPGAIVNFPGAEAFGDCGSVTASVPSGSFFPVGDTTVIVTSSTGGASCSFVVSVVADAAPILTCPANVMVSTDDCAPATVAVGMPTVQPSGAAIVGERSDDQPLDAPYPVGATTIIWTATDAQGRSDSCTQTVTVTSEDSEPPTIVAPPDVTLATPAGTAGSCGLVIGESQLGTAQASDNCTVNVARTGVPSGNFFPVGNTTVTYTATDASGNTATDTQIITVNDETPPIINAPPDANYTCLSEVPPGHPSQATGTDIIDANGNPQPGPPSDNCGTPMVTVTDSTTGAGSASSPLIITRTFTATDSAGNTASSVQTITVVDDTVPVISLIGPASQVVECHTSYTELGASATDNCNGSFAATPSGMVDVNVVGNYTITYNASDAVGNAASPVTRSVQVVDTTSPLIVLNGGNSITVECHTPFVDPGSTASDSCDASVSVNVSGSVNVDVPGSYALTYHAADDSGNTTSVVRTVTVVDTTAPTTTVANLTIFLNNLTVVFGENTVTVNGQTYPFNGVTFTHDGNTFTFNGGSIIINGTSYALEGKTLVLWTPLHQYQTVKVSDLLVAAADSCDAGINLSNVVIAQVTSDEVENKPGLSDGNTVNDIVIGPDCKSVQLRAERDNQGNGRVYTITMRVQDANGNTSTVTSQIKVRRLLQPAVDSGPQFTVAGNCP
jgi:hypothetical protein